jgi:hypothetical protein
LGLAGTASNSQCTLNAGASSVTTAGNDLILNVELSFSSAFGGLQSVYLYAGGLSGQNSGWVWKPAWWWIPRSAGPPAIVSLSIFQDSDARNTVAFKAVFADPNGANDLSEVLLQVNTNQSSANACYVYYQPQGNHVYLADNAGTAWLTPALTPSAGGTVSNGQCTLNNGGVVVMVGDELTLEIEVTFSGTFTGAKNEYLYAAGLSGQHVGWVKEGSLTP